MSETLPPDDRLISGAVIAHQLWFDVGPPMLTTSSSLQHSRNGRSIYFDISSMHDIRLEGAAGSLKKQLGNLCLYRDRELARCVGRLSAEPPDHYGITLHLDGDEFDGAWQLLLAGYHLERLEIEFDNEVEQWVETDGYWDEVRYPHVKIDSYRLDWIAKEDGPLARRHSMFGVKRASTP